MGNGRSSTIEGCQEFHILRIAAVEALGYSLPCPMILV